MGAQVNTQTSQYIVYDTRGLTETDAVYEAAIKITDEIMEGIDRLTYTKTIETATLFIISSKSIANVYSGCFLQEFRKCSVPIVGGLIEENESNCFPTHDVQYPLSSDGNVFICCSESCTRFNYNAG